ncbi:MAG: GNAT family N-acetyltransferase [Coriobacteriia bacterium]|nr:GNAT family N-acetyltransferase [Coriobacteriia bacterium]
MAQVTGTTVGPVRTAEGLSVALREINPEDLDTLKDMLREPGISRWWGMYDDERVRAEFLGDEVGVYLIEADGEPAGAIEFVENTDPDYRHAQVDLFVTERMQDRGVGTAAVKALVKHLFEDLGHHRVVAAPGAQNERAVRFFEDVGFKRVGTLRQYEKQPDGSWGDNVMLELLRGEFEA